MWRFGLRFAANEANTQGVQVVIVPAATVPAVHTKPQYMSVDAPARENPIRLTWGRLGQADLDSAAHL